MKRAFGCLMGIGFLILAYIFFLMWRGTNPLGVGTGNIGGRSSSVERGSGSGKSSTPSKGSTPSAGARTALSQISANPQKWEGKRVMVSGRVRGNTRYATNRNLYRLTDGNSSLLIVDDKTPPKEYSLRGVAGVVKVVNPPVGKGYAYIVNVKGDPKIDLKWQDVKGFFSGAVGEIKKGVHEATR